MEAIFTPAALTLQQCVGDFRLDQRVEAIDREIARKGGVTKYVAVRLSKLGVEVFSVRPTLGRNHGDSRC